jgi:iron(III) transport system substrate-binding protein
MFSRPAAVVLIALAAAAAGGCMGGGGERGELTVYSGRNERLVGPLFEDFERATGIETEVRYGDSAELAATIAEEGENSPADIFFAQDAGSLGSVAREGLLARLPQETIARVDERFRAPDGRWVGTSGRVRVVAYNTEALAEEELPDSIWAYASPRWRGRIGLPPTNASFQAMVTAMRLAAGDERTRSWLEAIEANDPTLYENNVQTVEAIAAGEIDVGFVNHYYLFGLLEEQPDAPVANHFLAPGDPGALVNVAGAGLVGHTDNREEAQRLLDFLLDDGQRYFAEETAEYPLVAGVPPGEELPPLNALQGPDIELARLGPELAKTLELLNAVGLTS